MSELDAEGNVIRPSQVGKKYMNIPAAQLQLGGDKSSAAPNPDFVFLDGANAQHVQFKESTIVKLIKPTGTLANEKKRKKAYYPKMVFFKKMSRKFSISRIYHMMNNMISGNI
jgi:hypothetical protein